ncbi:hypothetical protein ZWY2020_059563 [Hordeum vulgare]|nr:hypothetical protein ZWY2020_059563 [Hordeum vulgare]
MGMSSAAAEEDSVRGGGGDEEAMRFGNFLSLDLDDTLAWAGLRRPSSPLTAWASSPVGERAVPDGPHARRYHVSASIGQACSEENTCGKPLLQGNGHRLVSGNAGLGQFPEVLLGGDSKRFIILHGTIIDQFIACGRTGEKAHELASNIWIAVIDNLEENQQTFMLLKHLAQEGDFFLPFPYSRSYKVLWRVFDKLFTDFRDCFSGADYHEALAGAKSRFQPVPSSWIGH